MGGQRNSMFGTYGGTEKMKDPRPLHDKAFVQQCIKQLCEVCSILIQPHHSNRLAIIGPLCITSHGFLFIFFINSTEFRQCTPIIVGFSHKSLMKPESCFIQ